MKTKSSERKPRLPQRSRAREVDLPPFRLTTRDREIIRAVNRHRALTTKQISDLLFAPIDVKNPPAPTSRCLHRLKLLFQHGFLSRQEQSHLISEGRKHFVYQLDRRGLDWLALMDEVGDVDLGPAQEFSPLFLDHLITSNDVRIAIIRAATNHGFSVEEWRDERTLKKVQNADQVTLTSEAGQKQMAAVVPDGYFHLIADGHHYHQFLEIDLQTVTGRSKAWTTRTWARKVMTYLEYYRSGKYQERYHTKSLRILTVTTGKTRMTNLREITKATGGKKRFWFTTLMDVQRSDIMVDPIWYNALDEEPQSLVMADSLGG